MNRRLLRCHGFFKVSDIFSSTATLSTFGKGGAKVEQNLIHLWKRWSQSGAKPYPPLDKVEPKWSKPLSTFGKGGAKVEQNLINLWKRWSQSGAKVEQNLINLWKRWSQKLQKNKEKQRKTNKNKEKQIKHKIN